MSSAKLRIQCEFGGIVFDASDVASVHLPDGIVATHADVIGWDRQTLECLQDAQRRGVKVPLSVSTVGTMRARLVTVESPNPIRLVFHQDDSPNDQRAANPDELVAA